MSTTTEVDSKRVLAKELKAGDKLSETQYYTVLRPLGNSVEVKNERGMIMTISHGIVAEGMYSANQFNEEIPCNRTELIHVLENVGDTVFTVSFLKQPKATDIDEAIASINKGKILSRAEITKVVKEAFKGTERKMIARLINTETGFGRSNVIDLEIERAPGEYDTRIRQIDHRTIQYIIWRNKKYFLK